MRSRENWEKTTSSVWVSAQLPFINVLSQGKNWYIYMRLKKTKLKKSKFANFDLFLSQTSHFDHKVYLLRELFRNLKKYFQ